MTARHYHLWIMLFSFMFGIMVMTMVYNRILYSDSTIFTTLQEASFGMNSNSEDIHIVGIMLRTRIWPIHYTASIIFSLLALYYSLMFFAKGTKYSYVLLLIVLIEIISGSVLCVKDIEILRYTHYLLIPFFVYLLFKTGSENVCKG